MAPGAPGCLRRGPVRTVGGDLEGLSFLFGTIDVRGQELWLSGALDAVEQHPRPLLT